MLRSQGMAVYQIAKRTGISRQSIWRVTGRPKKREAATEVRIVECGEVKNWRAWARHMRW